MGKAKGAALTDKQERFCEEYLVDLNGTQAILRAGYKMTEASAATESSKLLRKPEVMARIQELRDAQSQRTQVTADYVIQSLAEVAERCMERAPVMVRRGRAMVHLVDEEGRHVWRFDSAGANTALGLLGKHLKLFADRIEHTGKDGNPIEHKNVSELSDDELKARIAALMPKEEG